MRFTTIFHLPFHPILYYCIVAIVCLVKKVSGLKFLECRTYTYIHIYEKETIYCLYLLLFHCKYYGAKQILIRTQQAC